MKRQPLLFCCLFFIFGIFFQEYFSLGKNYVIVLLAAGFLSFTLLLFKRYFFFRIRNISLFVFFFAFGIFLHFIYSTTPNLPEFKINQKFVFKISKKLNSNEKNRRYEAAIFQNNLVAKTVLSIPKSDPEPDFNHFYKGKIYVNQTLPPKNDYQFDYCKYLSRQKIYFQSYVPNGFVATERKTMSLGEKVQQKRLEVLQKIDRTEISSRSREFMKGIVLADRSGMDAETVRDWTKTGLVHILAISGSHMIIIFWLFSVLFRRIFPFRKKTIAIIFSLLFIWLFAVFIGYGNSVVRSCLMITTYYIYVLLQRKPSLLHSMSLAALIILALDTHQLFDVGFQLSFVAVFGIFWLNGPILKLFPHTKSKWKIFMMNVFSVSMAAQLATLPLVLFYFHQYSLISIIANLVVIPFSQIAIIFSFLMTLIIAINIKIGFLLVIYDYFVQFILYLIRMFSSVDFLFYENIAVSFVEVVLLFALFYLLRSLLMKFNRRRITVFATVLLIFMMVRVSLNIYERKNDEVMVHETFSEKYFSVKKNGKVIFWIPENEDREKAMKYIINPYLTSRRVKKAEIKTLDQNTQKIKYEGKFYHLK